MNTELKEAIAELEADLERGEYSGGGYRYIEADPEALRTVLAALPTPPADDVREALIETIKDAWFKNRRERSQWISDDRERGEHPGNEWTAIVNAIGAAFEVRPRGTVAESVTARNCGCACHIMPGVTHIAACCAVPPFDIARGVRS